MRDDGVSHAGSLRAVDQHLDRARRPLNAQALGLCVHGSAPHFRWRQQALDHFAVLQMALNDLLDVVLVHVGIPSFFRVHNHDRAASATIEATGLVDPHPAGPGKASAARCCDEGEAPYIIVRTGAGSRRSRRLMMQDSSDFATIVFLGLAAFVIWRLYSVLGMRTGHERNPRDMMKNGSAAPESKVVPLPGLRPEEQAAPETPSPDRWKGFAEPGSPVEEGLDAIAAADGGFDARGFTEGAKSAYEMIVTAFASGDRRMLKDLLAKDVFEGFAAAIADREKRGETVSTTFVSIDRAEIADARMTARTAQLTLRFVSKLITATRNAEGVIVDGAADKVVDVVDVWTFARETGSRDPNWKLVATEAGH